MSWFDSIAGRFTPKGRKRAQFHAYGSGLMRRAGLPAPKCTDSSVMVELDLPQVGRAQVLALSFWPFVDLLVAPGLEYTLDRVPRLVCPYLLHRNHQTSTGAWRGVFSKRACSIAFGQVVNSTHSSVEQAAWTLGVMLKEVQATVPQLRRGVHSF
ncbi:MAG TPA: hypothetical protein VGE52_11900 [Pirellulales bacterium]